MRNNIRRRLQSKLINNVVYDDLVSLKRNKSEIGSVEFGRLKKELMYKAFNNGSDNCIEYFISIGIELIKGESNFLLSCKLDRIEEVYNILLKYYGNEYKKEVIASRLLQPHKIDDNPSRLIYVSSLLESEFLTYEDVLKAINTNFASEQKKGKVISLLRDIKLMKLGI